MTRLLLAASTAAAAAAFTFILGAPAHADVGEIVLIQANGSTVLSTTVEYVDNTTAPMTIAAPETPGATKATVENHTNETIEVSVPGVSTGVGPQQTVSVPETGSGEIILTVPAGT